MEAAALPTSVAGAGAAGQETASLSIEPFRDLMAWILSVTLHEALTELHRVSWKPERSGRANTDNANTKMADRRLLQISKLGRIQLLSGPSPLTAFAGALLPENNAHPARELIAAPTAE